MDKLTQELHSLAQAGGADLMGFAPIERFITGPTETRPDYFMPRARSVVVIAIAYPRAISRVWGTYNDDGSLPGPYIWDKPTNAGVEKLWKSRFIQRVPGIARTHAAF